MKFISTQRCGWIVLFAAVLVGCSQPRLSPYERSRAAGERHDRAAAEIERLGGRVDPQERGAAVSMYLSDPQATRDAMAVIRNLSRIDALTLAPARPTNLELQTLGPLPSLRFLALRNARLTPDDIAYLNDLPNLDTLHLTNTGLTDEQANRLTLLGDVRQLTLVNEPITDATLRFMEGFDNLRRLRLVNTAATADAAEQLVEVQPRLIVEIDDQRIRGSQATE